VPLTNAFVFRVDQARSVEYVRAMGISRCVRKHAIAFAGVVALAAAATPAPAMASETGPQQLQLGAPVRHRSGD
jgi:hypothetical protein